MGLSSNTLWHMTKKDAFFSILKNRSFLYSYSLEKLLPKIEKQSIAFPMISMCDLPFSEIATTNWSYGDYAIGLSREWGVKNGFSPVWYCDFGSRVYNQLFKMLAEASKNEDKGYVGMVMYLLSNVKFVQAPLITSNRKFKNYRFYDEREYRLVPFITETDRNKVMPFMTEENYNEYKNLNGSSRLNFGITFDYSDIRYLIVNSESNIREVQDILKKQDVVSRINIVTKKEVMEDFIGINHNEEIVPNQETLDYEASMRHLERMMNKMRQRLNVNR